ncbi:CAP domain-containing protein [Saccharopolyspora dendranthemae]|uniref:Cysteine-rich secretory family protein n=1 Tax=Saccharopolyspora dendranthemae TaxID=1181886 RepID=A0A561U8L3_9PSEU|nr:CAP domain-containing protein [Saccharopolyspora dendranthemae]TWF95710.1 cysteine-rich secretory family protein [Saccharopolyspora dendranthemae]
MTPKTTLCVVAGVLLIGGGMSTAAVSMAADPKPPAQDQVVSLVNEARAEAGCAPLTVDGRLTKAATAHSADMASRGYFSHTTPEGVTFGDRLRDAGYASPGAENIARGHTSADQVVGDWMKSRGHRKNIMDCSLRTIGVGVEYNGHYWTQDFGR